jgi:small subunit ribosomal protein S13e
MLLLRVHVQSGISDMATNRYGSHVRTRQGHALLGASLPPGGPRLGKTTAPEVEEQIVRAAKKGMLSSHIGSLLRDVHGVPLVHGITGGKVLRLLRARGLAPEVPEDLYFLNKKAVAIRKHLDRNRTDVDAKFRLILIESRVHRLVRYYRRAKKIPASWKFESTAASTLVA